MSDKAPRCARSRWRRWPSHTLPDLQLLFLKENVPSKRRRRRKREVPEAGGQKALPPLCIWGRSKQRVSLRMGVTLHGPSGSRRTTGKPLGSARSLPSAWVSSLHVSYGRVSAVSRCWFRFFLMEDQAEQRWEALV